MTLFRRKDPARQAKITALLVEYKAACAALESARTKELRTQEDWESLSNARIAWSNAVDACLRR